MYDRLLPFDDVLHACFSYNVRFYKFATGTFKSGMNSEQVSGVFNNLMASPVEMIIWLAIIVVFGFFVCSRGLQKGIEKVSKVMMVALLALIIILAINSMMLSNAGEGLSFYLVPDFSERLKM